MRRFRHTYTLGLGSASSELSKCPKHAKFFLSNVHIQTDLNKTEKKPVKEARPDILSFQVIKLWDEIDENNVITKVLGRRGKTWTIGDYSRGSIL
jgi:hypothetical protein